MTAVRGPGGRTAVAARLPDGTTRVRVGDCDYYRWQDRCYRRMYYNGHVWYVGVGYPVGWYAESLPGGCVTVVHEGATYYYCGGTYYQKAERDGKWGYAVTESPTAKPEPSEEATPADAPDPFDLLKQMSDCLAKASRFSFEVTDTMDALSEAGQKIQLNTDRSLRIARPDRIQAEMRGSGVNRRVVYDGKAITMHDLEPNTYGVIEAPDNIDEMLDFVAEKYGMTIPLGDLVYSSPYDAVLPKTQTGRYLGLRKVGATECHYLAFQGEAVDWQIWIDAGDQPLPLKLVITYKLAPTKPRYAATFTKWDLAPHLPSDLFEFQPPDDAERLDTLPVTGEGT